MAVFKATNNFEVNPRGWSKLSDEDIVRMFDTFEDWLIMNEEHMTFIEAEKAWKIYDAWAAHLESRGLKKTDQHFGSSPTVEKVNGFDGGWNIMLV